jgi:DNA-binding NarL/FixJ family response regulator
MAERGVENGEVQLTRLTLADPLTVFRLGVRSFLGEQRDFEMSEAASLAELEQVLRSRVRPDLALVDLDLPPTGAFDALGVLRGAGISAVVWTHRGRLSPGLVFDLVREGAVGVLSKEISPSGLVRALRGVTRGEAPLGRDIASLLIDGVRAASTDARAQRAIGTLSGREREVLELVSEGRANKEIAAELCVSVFTVKRHVQNILRKLGVDSRWEAVAEYVSVL